MKNKIPEKFKYILNDNLNASSEIFYARAPGRINLIGEHTDYNKGLVLPAAIDKYMYFACSLNESKKVTATAIDLNETITIDLNNLNKTEYLWADFLTGILLEFKKLDIEMSGFDCSFTSEVPIGAGVSSSSALECAFLVGIKEMYKLEIPRWDLIKMSKSSNHNFLGIKGGILDQFASFFGQSKKIMLLDCNTLEFNYVNLPSNQYTWLLINTCVKHNHIESGYNDRVNECNQALIDIQKVYPKAEHLSDIKDNKQLAEVKFSTPILKKRSKFIVEENARVRSFVRNLTAGEFHQCGILLYGSHEGLSKDYEVSCPELDFLVTSLFNHKSVLGSRMMGGGFGGCTLNLVEASATEAIKTEVFENYKNKFGLDAKFHKVNISDGAERLYD